MLPQYKMKNLTVMMNPELSSFSILTHPYRVPAGWRLSFGYFGTDPKLMETHLIQQLRKLDYTQNISPSEDLHIFVDFEPEMKSRFYQLMQNFKIDRFVKTEFQGKKLGISCFEKRVR